MNRSTVPLLGLVRAPLRAFVEVPVMAGAPFESVEIQRLGGDSNRDGGILVKLQHGSGEVDIYFEPLLGLTPQWFRADPGFAHLTLGSMHPTEFDRLEFEVDGREVDLDVRFIDRSGRQIHAHVHHQARRAAPPMFVPATPQIRPSTLRLLYLEHFRLIPRRTSAVGVEVDGESLALRPFLVPGRVASHWSARAASGVVMASCNGDSDGAGRTRVGDDRSWLEVMVEPRSDPGSGPPDLGSGTFQISAPVGTVTSGGWTVRSATDGYDVTLSDVRQNWFPGWSRPAALMLWAARRLRRRNQPWAWQGRLRSEAGDWHRRGRWTVDR